MPLNKSCSVDAFEANIKAEIEAGKDRDQAVAIAFDTLKDACGVDTDERLSAKEIVSRGKRESVKFYGMTLEDYRRLTHPLYEAKDYPGLNSPKQKQAISKGYLDLGLVDPSAIKVGPNTKAAAAVRKLILELLVKTKKQGAKSAFIRDPEGILKKIYKGKMVKHTLTQDLEDAVQAITDTSVEVKMRSVKGKTGDGWQIAAKGLEKTFEHVEAALAADEMVELIEQEAEAGDEQKLKKRLGHAKQMFGKARKRRDKHAMRWWKLVHQHTKKALKKVGGGDEAGGGGGGGGGEEGGSGEEGGGEGGEHETFFKALKSKSKAAAKAFKDLPSSSKKFFTSKEHRKKVATAAAKSFRKKATHAVKHVRDEIHEFKDAGKALGKLAKGGKLSGHEKKALKQSAKTIATTVAGTIAMGGLAHVTLAGLAGHWAAETAIKSVAKAAVMAHMMRAGGGPAYLTEEEIESKMLEVWAKNLVHNIAEKFEDFANAGPDEVMEVLQQLHGEGDGEGDEEEAEEGVGDVLALGWEYTGPGVFTKGDQKLYKRKGSWYINDRKLGRMSDTALIATLRREAG